MAGRAFKAIYVLKDYTNRLYRYTIYKQYAISSDDALAFHAG